MKTLCLAILIGTGSLAENLQANLPRCIAANIPKTIQNDKL